MPFPESDEPKWRERAKAIEYWAVAAFVASALLYGVVSAVRGLLGL